MLSPPLDRYARTRDAEAFAELTLPQPANNTPAPPVVLPVDGPPHAGQPEGYLWEPFSDDHLHYVPLRSLIPADADNVLATGRCIDGDAAALSSVRVMGPCIGMGAAAAHALDLAGSGSVQRVDLGALRRRLIHNLEG